MSGLRLEAGESERVPRDFNKPQTSASFRLHKGALPLDRGVPGPGIRPVRAVC